MRNTKGESGWSTALWYTGNVHLRVSLFWLVYLYLFQVIFLSDSFFRRKKLALFTSAFTGCRYDGSEICGWPRTRLWALDFIWQMLHPASQSNKRVAHTAFSLPTWRRDYCAVLFSFFLERACLGKSGLWMASNYRGKLSEGLNRKKYHGQVEERIGTLWILDTFATPWTLDWEQPCKE